MSFYDVIQSFQAIDDSSISVLAMLIGIVGGWIITSMHQKMKAERVKAEKRHAQLRNRDDR
jgi:xanthine/uracil permease